MLGFGRNKKDKKTKGKIDQEKIDPKLTEQIHIMPDRFFIKPSKKRSRSTWIIAIGVFVIIVLGSVAVYLFFTLRSSTDQLPEQQVNAEDIQEEDIAVDEEPDILTPPDPEVADSAIEEEDEIFEEDSIDDPDIIEAQDLAVDSDGDNLTLAEEQLFLTDETAVDSDEDGFADGTEVLNGYDPNAVGKTLIETGTFRQYANGVYSISYPSIWEFREQNIDNTEVLFISETGEFVEVLILPNINNLSLQEWYSQQFPEFSSIAPIQIKINNVDGILHPNGRNYYLTVENDLSRIYIVTYNVGNFIELKYQTIFRSMVNSFKVNESL